MKDIAKALTYTGIFAVPFIVLIITNSTFFPYITGKNFTFRIIVEIIFSAWVVLAFYDAQYRPKFSWIFASFFALLAVMFVANYQGEYPLKSFWSNFERMEGYVTLVHAFLYMVVLGSVMTSQKLWLRYFNTIIGVAVILALYAFAQLSGSIEIRQGGWRLDGTLGNSAYMAVYSLFLTFISAYMLLQAKSVKAKYAYGAVALLFIYLLIQTATRGTMVGLVGGSFVSVAYVALFAKGHPAVRKTAAGGLIALVAIVALFVTLKDTPVIQENPYLQRIASINMKEASNRFNIWGMAYEGVLERPVLGWGQGNYNYVFNTYYKPELHGQEAWFDRVHNIVMDWLIAGGYLGLIAYFSILLSAVYYLFVRPLMNKEDESFTVIERGLLLGLLGGYLVHNMFVFDNIVSYIFYASILAFIHSRVATPIEAVAKKRIDANITTQVVAPVMIVVCVAAIIFVNVPNIQASRDIIRAFRTNDPETMYQWFDTALSRGSFGNQEIREQFTQRGISVINQQEIPVETKEKFRTRIEEEIMKQIEEKPGDARIHVFASTFYRSTGELEKAKEQLDIARSLSPQKQVIMFEQAFNEIALGNTDTALELFKTAYDLGPNLKDVRNNYAIGAVFAKDYELLDEILETEEQKRLFALNQNALNAMYRAGEYERLGDMFRINIEEKPNDVQLRTSLAFILNETGDVEGAIEVLRQAGEDIPSFKTQADQFITELQNPAEVGVEIGGEAG